MFIMESNVCILVKFVCVDMYMCIYVLFFYCYVDID